MDVRIPGVKAEIMDEPLDEAGQLRANLEKARAELRQSYDEIADLRRSCKALENEKEDMKIANIGIPKLRAENKSLREDNVGLKRTLKAAQDEVEALREKLNKKTSSDTEVARLQRALKEAAEEAAAKQKKLEDDLAKEREQHQQLKNEWELIGRRFVQNPRMNNMEATPQRGASLTGVKEENSATPSEAGHADEKKRDGGRGKIDTGRKDETVNMNGQKECRSTIGITKKTEDDNHKVEPKLHGGLKKVKVLSGDGKDGSIVTKSMNPPAHDVQRENSGVQSMGGLEEEKGEKDEDDWSDDGDSDEDDVMNEGEDNEEGEDEVDPFGSQPVPRKRRPRGAKKGIAERMKRANNGGVAKRKRTVKGGGMVKRAQRVSSLGKEGTADRVMHLCRRLAIPITMEELFQLSSAERWALGDRLSTTYVRKASDIRRQLKPALRRWDMLDGLEKSNEEPRAMVTESNNLGAAEVAINGDPTTSYTTLMPMMVEYNYDGPM